MSLNPYSFKMEVSFHDTFSPRHLVQEEKDIERKESNKVNYKFNNNSSSSSSLTSSSLGVSTIKKLSKARPLTQAEIWKNEVNAMKQKIVMKDMFSAEEITQVAGVYAAVNEEDSSKCNVAITLHEYPSMKMLDCTMETYTYKENHVAGYTSFRVIEFILQSISKLKISDKCVYIVYGPGLLHSNGFGLASHLGCRLAVPVIGVSETVSLIDGITKEQLTKLAEGLQAGEYKNIMNTKEKKEYGSIIKTTEKDNVLYISVGNNISLDTANTVVYTSCPDDERLPACLKSAKDKFEIIVEVEDE